MKNERVLLIGPLPPPTGGDTISTLNLFKSSYWKSSGIVLDHIDASGENRLRLPGEKRSSFEVVRAMRIFFKMICKIPRAKLVLLWANSSFICTFGPVVLLFSSFMRKPVLIKPFGSLLAEMIDGFGNFRKKITLSTLKKARYILPQTLQMAAELVDRTGFDKDRILYFPNFLPDTAFKINIEKKAFSGKCLFVGQIKKEKGVFRIIEGLRGEREFSCDFYGQLVERDTGSFLEEMSSNDNFAYRGILDPEDVIDTICRYDILLLPTSHEGEGMPAVILQAFAAHVPVIATDWKSIPDIVRDRDTGILIPVESTDALGEAVKLLASDSRLYDRIAETAFESVKSFSEKAIVKELLIERTLRLL